MGLSRDLKNFGLALAVAVPAIIIEYLFLREAPQILGLDGDFVFNWDAGNLWKSFCKWGLDHPISMLNLVFFLNVDVLFWVISLFQGSTWLIDPYWTFLPPMIAHFYAAHPAAVADHFRSTVVLALVWLWSIRLTHSYFRRENWQWGKREDWRFATMRKDFGSNWWWMSFFIAFFSQHILLVGICLPFYAVHSSSAPWRPWADGTATCICIASVVFSYFADTQLHVFVSENQRLRALGLPRAHLLDEGLWRYSRHPNHFGEQIWWWGLCLFGWNVGKGWVVIGTMINSLCMAQVTVMVEERMLADPSRAELYRRYQKTTSVWVPWFKRQLLKDIKVW